MEFIFEWNKGCFMYKGGGGIDFHKAPIFENSPVFGVGIIAV